MKEENKKDTKKIVLDNRKKTKRKKKQIKIFVYIGTITLSIYIFYAIYLLLINPTDKVTVEEGTLYQEEIDIGYIIRTILRGSDEIDKIRKEDRTDRGRLQRASDCGTDISPNEGGISRDCPGVCI